MHQQRKHFEAVVVLCAVFASGAALRFNYGRLGSAQAADTTARGVAASPKAGSEADEKAIRQTADEFAKAFNAGDAKAVGLLWALDSEYIDESGQSFQGRAVIEKEYAAALEQHRGAIMTIKIESIRFLAADIAMEKGVARVKSPGGIADTAARYTVVHAKRDGKWTMVFGRDAPYVAASNEDYLKDLEWVIGDWNPDAKDQPLRLHFEWMAQENFIKNTYTGHEGRSIDIDRRPDHRLESQAGAESSRGISTPRAASARTSGPRTARSGSSRRPACSATAARAQRSTSSRPLDANSFTWQSMQANTGRSRPSRYAARQNRTSAFCQIAFDSKRGIISCGDSPERTLS